MSKVIFITGVSSGLGKHTAGYLAKKGHKVYGTTRKDVEPNSNLTFIKMDVTGFASVQHGVDLILQKEGRIDVLINNAGMGYAGAIEDFSADEAHLEMNTNFYGVVNTIQAVLPVMRQQGSGLIININSLGGLMGLPFQGFYSASKFAVEGLSEALRMELKQFNISIVQINPGDHQTQFTANRKMIAKTDESSAYQSQFNKTLAIIENDERNGLKPIAVAKKINSILQKKHPRTRYIVSSFEQKLAVLLKHILPGTWFGKVLEGHYGIK
jgi:NAD(P)-dependent dehydrogenase (short-subunit alcohol dehydrogenase family)